MVSPRWVALIALLAGEAIALTVRFDARLAGVALPRLVLGLPRLLFHLGVAVASVALLVRSAGRIRLAAPAGALPDPSHRPWPYIVAHCGALLGFTWLSTIVLEGGTRSLLPALGWAFAWAGM